ncbi:hypothetical protein ACVWW2_007611 [Bradyrhizobium sp. LM4.3]
MRPPSRKICAASSQSRGPCPAITVRPSGTNADDFNIVCAAPAVITPGSVQPGIGNGRSSAPVARITRFALTKAEAPPIETAISRLRSRLQTVARWMTSALLARNACTRSAPTQ